MKNPELKPKHVEKSGKPNRKAHGCCRADRRRRAAAQQKKAIEAVRLMAGQLSPLNYWRPNAFDQMFNTIKWQDYQKLDCARKQVIRGFLPCSPTS